MILSNGAVLDFQERFDILAVTQESTEARDRLALQSSVQHHLVMSVCFQAGLL